LAAIELRHCRHQPPLRRSALGEREAFVERQRRIVPREILGFGRRCGLPGPALAQQPGEETVEPRALRRGKRCGFRKAGRDEAHLAARRPMAGLDPAIHVFVHRGAGSRRDVDARVKPGQGDFLGAALVRAYQDRMFRTQLMAPVRR